MQRREFITFITAISILLLSIPSEAHAKDSCEQLSDKINSLADVIQKIIVANKGLSGCSAEYIAGAKISDLNRRQQLPLRRQLWRQCPQFRTSIGNLDDFEAGVKKGAIALQDFYSVCPQIAAKTLSRGIGYWETDKYDLAITDFTEVIEIEPKNDAAFFNRGLAYDAKKEYDRAIQDFGQAIKLDHKNAVAYYNRGNVYEKKNDYARAALDYDAAILLAPTNAAIWNGRCWVRTLAGLLEQAVKDCNELLRLEPVAITFDTRGLAFFKLGQFDRAIADYDAALKIDPKLAPSLYGRGLAKQMKGKSADGNDDITAARAIQSNIGEEFVRYGVAAIGAAIAPVQTSAPTPLPAADCAQAETHWKSAEEIKSVAVYQDHLARFATCNFAALATARIEQLKK